jgi:hypothetical protein
MLDVCKGRMDNLTQAQAMAVARLLAGPVPASLDEAQKLLAEALPGWCIKRHDGIVLARRDAGEPESIRFSETPERDSYYDRVEAIEVCPDCAWVGSGCDLKMGDSFDQGSEYHCPVCDHYFGFRAYPLISEVKTDPRADPIDKALIEMTERRMRDLG